MSSFNYFAKWNFFFFLFNWNCSQKNLLSIEILQALLFAGFSLKNDNNKRNHDDIDLCGKLSSQTIIMLSFENYSSSIFLDLQAKQAIINI